MVLAKPVGNIMGEDGDKYLQAHSGKVADNNDPEKKGRVKVAIDMWDYLTTEQLPWVRPKNSGAFLGGSAGSVEHAIPEIGSDVSVTFNNGNADDPRYEGTEINDSNKCPLFDEFYPNTYGRKDSVGNFEIVNKETGVTVRQYKSGTKTQHDPDGSVTVITPDGMYFNINGSNGEITLRASKINLVSDDDINLNATNINIKASHKVDITGDIVRTFGEKGNVMGSNVDITLASKHGILFSAPDIEASTLAIASAPDAMVLNLMNAKYYKFTKGILTATGP